MPGMWDMPRMMTPEIAVVAFVYNGREGSTVAAPIVRQIMEGYFELKAIDTTAATEE